MTNEGRRRSTSVTDSVRDLLQRNWWPVPDDQEAEYVNGVITLLRSGPTAKQLAAHLVQVETHQLAYQDTDAKMLVPLANKLLRLRLHCR